MWTWARVSVLMVTAVVLSGCLEEQLPEGVFDCRPGAPAMCPEGWVCRPVQCPAEYRCFRPDPGERPQYPAGCVEDGFCDRDACESCVGCPSDCCPVCDEASLRGLPAVDFLVSRYLVPTSSAESETIGADLDGDGTIDNKFGGLISLFNYEDENANPNGDIAARIAAGEVLVVLRVYLDDFGADNAEALVQVVKARVVDATPLHQGADTVALASDAVLDPALCGERIDQQFDANPSAVSVPFPLPMDLSRLGFLWLPLERVQLSGAVGPDGWPAVDVGGGLSWETLETQFFPWWAAVLNERILADPDGGSASLGLDVLDGNCIMDIEGCDPSPAGCVADGLVHADEIRCNALITSALAPDVDLGGELSLVSIGVRLTAVPVTVVQ